MGAFALLCRTGARKAKTPTDVFLHSLSWGQGAKMSQLRTGDWGCPSQLHSNTILPETPGFCMGRPSLLLRGWKVKR